MVLCQPRQLVILSLPFAALVAFFWYKRRKSLSRSDPGGTVDQKKPVDNKTQTNRLTESDEEESCEKKIKDSNSVIVNRSDIFSPTEKRSIKPVDELILTVEKKNTEESIPVIDKITCNGLIVDNKDSFEVVSKQGDFSLTESNCIFNSTVIEDEKDFNKSVDTLEIKGDETERLAVISVESNSDIDSVTDEADLDNTLIDNRIVEIVQDIPHEVNTTIKHITLKLESVLDEVIEISEAANKIVCNDVVQESELNISTAVEKLTKNIPSTIEGDWNKKGASSTTSENISTSTLSTENLSTDTGLGSQDLTPIKNMAQGHDAEEKNESSATGLESKLVSLGLDTQPLQQAERDSANHSPAEVMLNSPAISTFSDAHSEVVMEWLRRYKPWATDKRPKGSSDSGKGCSEVVTPPSRTPAGGSSVSGDQLPSVYEFVLPQVIVGRLIGRHGAFLQDIRAKTHTNVFIKRHPETTTLKICAIEGTQQDIDAALKMIRQKFPLRRFPDLTLERVSFVKTPSMPISPENMYLSLVEGLNNDVVISSLISAGHFFLQMPMHLSYQCLYRLACVMNTVYSTGDSPALPDPQPGMVCVAPSTGGWYRALTLAVDEEANTSDIKFLDYGGFLTVDNSMLRQIRIDFLQLPFQAVECVLANVVPAGGEEEWSEEAKLLVQQMTLNQMLQAVVYHYTEEGMPCVGLYCTQYFASESDPNGIETKVVLINQELVARGFAELVNTTEEE